jgi:hypothetical protein
VAALLEAKRRTASNYNITSAETTDDDERRVNIRASLWYQMERAVVVACKSGCASTVRILSADPDWLLSHDECLKLPTTTQQGLSLCPLVYPIKSCLNAAGRNGFVEAAVEAYNAWEKISSQISITQNSSNYSTNVSYESLVDALLETLTNRHRNLGYVREFLEMKRMPVNYPDLDLERLLGVQPIENDSFNGRVSDCCSLPSSISPETISLSTSSSSSSSSSSSLSTALSKPFSSSHEETTLETHLQKTFKRLSSPTLLDLHFRYASSTQKSFNTTFLEKDASYFVRMLAAEGDLEGLVFLLDVCVPRLGLGCGWSTEEVERHVRKCVRVKVDSPVSTLFLSNSLFYCTLTSNGFKGATRCKEGTFGDSPISEE